MLVVPVARLARHLFSPRWQRRPFAPSSLILSIASLDTVSDSFLFNLPLRFSRPPLPPLAQTFDLSHAVEKLVQTTLRSIIGDMGLDDTLASREEINRGLMQKIHNVCLNWGVSITKVELLEITPTATVQNAMHKQLEAERVRRASIVEADGLREQTKTMAEGECQAQIAIARGQAQVKVLRARGKADKKRLLAQAEARAVNTIAAAVAPFDVNPTHYLVALRYIDTFLKVASNAQKRSLYFPCQTDVVGSLSALSAQ